MRRSFPKPKKTPEFQYWYPIKTVLQPSLIPGVKGIFVDIPQTGHLLYQGRLLCKKSMEILKNKCGAKSQKTVSTRIQFVDICEDCLVVFKEIPELAWAKWVNPPEPKHPVTIQINPELKGSDDGKEKRPVVSGTARSGEEVSGNHIEED